MLGSPASASACNNARRRRGAAGLALLLVVGIRNAWDMIIFFAARDRRPE
jgi:hypothetical protein